MLLTFLFLGVLDSSSILRHGRKSVDANIAEEENVRCMVIEFHLVNCIYFDFGGPEYGGSLRIYFLTSKLLFFL